MRAGFREGAILLVPGFAQDPYPQLAKLREAAPIHWSNELFGGAWLLTRYADIEAALGDPRFSARRVGGWVMGCAESASSELREFQRFFSRAMLFTDDADHRRLRGAMQASFRAETLQALRLRIETWVDAQLDRVDPDRGFDFMQEIADELPGIVVSDLLGLPAYPGKQLRGCIESLSDFMGSPRPTLIEARRAQMSVLRIVDHFQACIGNDPPAHGLLGDLLRAESAGKLSDRTELLAQCVMVYFGAHETSRNSLGNAVYHLVARPEAWEKARQQGAALRKVVRELLRFDSPVQYTGRRVATDLEMYGVSLQRGDLVIGLIGAANRDPRRFERPDQLEFDRSPSASLAFGAGPHACIGAGLSLLEVEVVVERLLRRFSRLHLWGRDACWGTNALYRGLTSLRLIGA